jgi:hypothetical protein
MALDSVLESDRRLQQYVVACQQCGIRFLTHPRCAGRTDLRCPFGCRQHHRRQRSSQRSAAYYRTPSGKAKKECLNRLRYRRSPAAADPPQPDPGPPMASPTPLGSPEENGTPTAESPEKIELRLEGMVLDKARVTNSPLLPYVRMMLSLIEGIRLTCQELVRLLHRALRQHSFAFRSRTDYVLRFLHEHPP